MAQSAVVHSREIFPGHRSRPLLTETAGVVLLSILSPIAGLTVETALAWRFGISSIIDAYRMVVLLVLFGQQIFVSSVLPFVIVPVFAEYRAQKSEKDAWIAADSLGYTLLLFGAAIAFLFFVFPEVVTTLVAPGLVGAGRATAVYFVRWCGLAFIPLCWSGVACGTLYACGEFRVAPMAQLASNIVLLSAILLGRAPGASSIIYGVVLGAAASAAVYTLNLARVRRKFCPGHHTRTLNFAAMTKTCRLAAPLVIGILVAQTSSVVGTRVMSHLAAGTLAAFGYSWKLGQIVLLIPTALSTVLFPEISEYWQANDFERFTSGYARAIRAMFFLAIPMMFIAYAFRGPIVSLVLQRGAFSASSAELTTMVVGILILGTPGSAAASCMSRMFYATQETVLPVIIDASVAVLAMVLISSLASWFGIQGVAFFHMLSPWCTFILLYSLFKHRHLGRAEPGLPGFMMRLLISGAVSAWIGSLAGGFCASLNPSASLRPALSVAIGVSISLILFLISTSLLGVPEAASANRLLRRYVLMIRKP